MTPPALGTSSEAHPGKGKTTARHTRSREGPVQRDNLESRRLAQLLPGHVAQGKLFGLSPASVSASI